ncbi:SDR family NAD(P)-dependent oxidoreductase [Pedobacter sp. UYP1]|uniref:SDR family NAD(P)-dependent oxidoreductase n=1 Tax=Pedobacter sp. UYP1 TaxID=1756396 RepID=UPI00339A16C6
MDNTKKSILIVGAGEGLSKGVAKRFAKEGFNISLISRNANNLKNVQAELTSQGAEVTFAAADVSNSAQLDAAIKTLSEEVSGFDVVLYNVAIVKSKDILEETADELTHEFAINVSGALQSLQSSYQDLKQKKGAFLLTGGGLAIHPVAAYGSLSLGKSGIRSLAYQLHDRLKVDEIYVGLLTVAGIIKPESKTHSPTVLAEMFWKLYSDRTELEAYTAEVPLV